jgi:FMN phosphatase YigB (HAD superfamily)
MSKEICKSIYFFDLDDTLVETTQFNEAAVRNSLEVLEQFNVNISQNDAWEYYLTIYQDIKASSDMMKLYYKNLYSSNPNKFNDLDEFTRLSLVGVCMYEEYFENNIKDFIPKGVKETLEKKIKEGSKLGIISQGRPGFQIQKFNNLGLEKYFDETLRFYFDKKTEKNYKNVFKEVSSRYPDAELFMVGDREDIDILRSRELGFTPIRIVGSGKYSDVKTKQDYLEFKSFSELYKSLK